MPERHEKLSQAIGLVLSLAGSRTGRTMAEMMEELGCSRRTVERLLAALRQAQIEIEEVPTDEAWKRWRVPPNKLVGALRLTATEIAEIEAAAKRLSRAGLAGRAATLRGAANKLRALMDDRSRRSTEADVEALLRSEGLASRPGPRVVVAEGVIEALRHALLACHRVRLRYRSAEGEERVHLVEPCGLLYGDRPYLLAAVAGKPDAATWRLDRVTAVERTEEPFAPRPGQDVATLMRDCFGVWRSEPVEVVLRFAPSAARDAAGWQFHASQQAPEMQPDGSLVIRFRAAGLREMAHHLATWGDTVEVLEPAALREELAELGAALVRRHGDRQTRAATDSVLTTEGQA